MKMLSQSKFRFFIIVLFLFWVILHGFEGNQILDSGYAANELKDVDNALGAIVYVPVISMLIYSVGVIINLLVYGVILVVLKIKRKYIIMLDIVLLLLYLGYALFMILQFVQRSNELLKWNVYWGLIAEGVYCIIMLLIIADFGIQFIKGVNLACSRRH